MIEGKTSAVLSKPKRASMKSALEFLNSNLDWLEKRLSEVGESLSLREYLKKRPHVYANGRKWDVWTINARGKPFFIEDANAGELVLACPEDSADETFEKLFADFARKKIMEQAEKISLETGIKFGRLSVRDQSSRWASRSSNGSLSFNWRIVLLCRNFRTTSSATNSPFRALWTIRFHSGFFSTAYAGAKRLDARLSKEGEEIFRIARK
ncbi:MAG: YgjP-like metallopeptidase domain-containing protein [Bacilli bacterium]